MTIDIVDDELETRQYMQGLVAQYLAETGRMAQGKNGREYAWIIISFCFFTI